MKKIIAISITILLSATLCACGHLRGSSSTAGTGSNQNTSVGWGSNKTGATSEAVSTAAPQPTIIPTAASQTTLVPYSTEDFSMQIPSGWTVTTGGTGMAHSIRVYDPEQPVNQIFILIKAMPLMHSESGRSYYQQSYDAYGGNYYIMADAPVLSNPSTQGFFEIFSSYADYVEKDEPTYAGYEFPRFNDFTVVDRFPANSGLKNYALNDELLRATFTDNTGKEGEGLFTASVVDFGSMQIAAGPAQYYMIPTADGGYYMAYNIVAITAVKDTFIEWEALLTECMNSLKYSDSFVSATNQASNEKVALANHISQNFNEIMDGMMDSWEKRSTAYDIMSQKQSDATLGYERIYNTETNEVYRVPNGWSDEHESKKYQPVTDDNMYTLPISGYID